LFNKPDPRAFGVLVVSAPAIHEAARALVSPATSKALRG
jgi:myo-inositol-1(or 4)-monophosphatase